MPLNHEMRLMLVNTLRKASLSMYDVRVNVFMTPE